MAKPNPKDNCHIANSLLEGRMTKNAKVRLTYTRRIDDDAKEDDLYVSSFGNQVECIHPDFDDGDVLVVFLKPNKIDFSVRPEAEIDNPGYIPLIDFELKLHAISEEAKNYRLCVSDLKRGNIGIKIVFEADRARQEMHNLLAFRVFEVLRDNMFDIPDDNHRFYFCKTLVTAWFKQIGRCEEADITEPHPYIGSLKPFLPDYSPV